MQLKHFIERIALQKAFMSVSEKILNSLALKLI